MASLEDRHWWFIASRRILVDLFRPYLPRSGTLLDIGCGTGHTLGQFGATQPGLKPVGLDSSSTALRTGSGDGHLSQVQGLAEQLPFSDGSIAAVLALDVLEHLSAPLSALAELFRVLQPGGVALISGPAYPALFGPHDRSLGHYRRFRRRELANLVTAAGFRIERLTHYNTVLALPIAAVRLLHRLTDNHEQSGSSDLFLPPLLLNAILAGLFAVELHWLRRSNLPAGISLVMIVRKDRATT